MSNDIITYKFRNNLPLEFEIVDVAQLYQQKYNMLVNPHRTGFFHILWITKGQTTHTVDFNTVTLNENSLLFLNKDIVHSYSSVPFEGKSILFTEDFFCRTLSDIQLLKNSLVFNNTYGVSSIELGSENRSAFKNLTALIEQEIKKGKDDFTPEILKNHLHSIILIAERELTNKNAHKIIKGPDSDYVILLRDLLEDNFKLQKQVKFYASGLSVTEKRLNAATSKVLGKTVKQIIDDRIMLEAKRLLGHTNDSIKTIGYILGFDEPTNFIKYFKKHHNATPVEFRESL
ncbi:AraC family transcriptional regulator [Chryseobacterium sp. Leaf404]|uniref:AraC family transcriptional regulator n=1 Tax=unclassified Chryseobacterium TaxID=2593645 RepID=UPI0006FEB407|nr:MULTISPECIES: AraC family transcriptional regulator [unclassified Chryseobacterium]KQT15112.1 AraC family transcriptional regulator [Chryseobacterium sp. Leaf404]